LRLRAPESRRRAVVVGAVAVALVAVAAVVVFVGRWERRSWVDAQLAGMRRVVHLVGPLDQPLLSGYRLQPQFDCLVYRRGGNVFALELCVAGDGRLIEAIDRRSADRRYYDLHADPGAAAIRINRAEVDRLLRKMGARAAP